MLTYDLHLIFPDNSRRTEATGLDLKAAVLKAHDFSTRPAAMIGIIHKIMITDSEDYCVFLWQDGNIIFPRQTMEPT